MNLSFSDWIGLAVMAIGWVISGTLAWRKIHEKINGLGGRTNALELTSATHERVIEEHSVTLRDSAGDRRILFEKAGELRADVDGLRKALESRDTQMNRTLTDIQVELGKLGTKVDILIEGRLGK